MPHRQPLKAKSGGEIKMKKILFFAILACLISTTSLAREDSSIEIDYHLATGGKAGSLELKCKGTQCKTEIKGEKKTIEITQAQQKAIFEAIQAEVKRYIVSPHKFSSLQMNETGKVIGNRVKLQFRYNASGSEIKIELDIPYDTPSGLSKEMVEVIKQHFDVDMSKPKKPPTPKRSLIK